MSKHLQLTIPVPCHENWDNMSPVEKGRFCSSCQKQVIDFSNMSDREIGQFFKKPSTGSVCGRFMQDQLDRDIAIPKKRIPWVKYFFQFVLPAFLLSMKATAQGKVTIINQGKASTCKEPLMGVPAQITGTFIEPHIKKPGEQVKSTQADSINDKSEIRGKVVEEKPKKRLVLENLVFSFDKM